MLNLKFPIVGTHWYGQQRQKLRGAGHVVVLQACGASSFRFICTEYSYMIELVSFEKPEHLRRISKICKIHRFDSSQLDRPA